MYSNIIIYITFFINIPDFKAILRLITTTDGTANPSAHGHDATSIDIALSIGKHQIQNSFITTKSK